MSGTGQIFDPDTSRSSEESSSFSESVLDIFCPIRCDVISLSYKVGTFVTEIEDSLLSENDILPGMFVDNLRILGDTWSVGELSVTLDMMLVSGDRLVAMFFFIGLLREIDRLGLVDGLGVLFDATVFEDESVAALIVKDGDFLVFVFLHGGGVILVSVALLLDEVLRVGKL